MHNTPYTLGVVQNMSCACRGQGLNWCLMDPPIYEMFIYQWGSSINIECYQPCTRDPLLGAAVWILTMQTESQIWDPNYVRAYILLLGSAWVQVLVDHNKLCREPLVIGNFAFPKYGRYGSKLLAILCSSCGNIRIEWYVDILIKQGAYRPGCS